MDKSRELYNKLNSGDRVLTDDEAELIMEFLKSIKIEKGGYFEKRSKVLESLSLSSDSCLSCGRPY